MWMDCLVVVSVIFCVFKVDVVAVSPGQDGGQSHFQFHNTQPTQYSRESILLLRSSGLSSPPTFDFLPPEMNPDSSSSAQTTYPMHKRKRGKRGGLRRRLRRMTALLPLPTIIFANTRSIRPKHPNYNFDELAANVSYMQEYRDACLLCLTETWFDNKISDESVYLDGFGVPYRCDRNPIITQKESGGGACIYVNNRYCSEANVTVRKRLCTPDVELISLSLRPKYLPREFGQIFVTTVYAHPRANQRRAATEIAEVVRSLQTLSPDAPNFVLGDFNSCDLRTTLPAFKQYVTTNTRLDNKPDRCYGNIPLAYKSFLLPEIGRSDHMTVHLLPTYKPKIQTNPVVTRTVKVWSTESTQQLQACLECTDWHVFLDSSDSIDSATDVISDYITFCKDMLIPEKTVKIYPNNKPWVTKALKNTLNEKKIAFQTGDRMERKRVQAKLRNELRKAKMEYKEKVEQQFAGGDMRQAWKGLKTLTGQDKPQPHTFSMPLSEREEHANKLNEFYCRFERDDVEEKLSEVMADLKERVGGGSQGSESESCVIEESAVLSLFRRINVRKACGPDNICGRILKYCASQLSYVFTQLFTWSVKVSVVPSVWKNSTICPVPKNRNPSALNDYRPIALTSIVMKCFERIMLRTLLAQTQPHLDPFQFAYKQNRSTDDATLTLLHKAYSHLDTPKSFARILFIDFSSAFNTIQPHLLALKLLKFDVSPKLILWIVDFLVNRSQAVCFQQAFSSIRNTSVGSPQGTCLSPVLFTLYTNDCSGTDSSLLIKYSDDTALLDLTNSHSTFAEQVEKFSTWCTDNYLDLNVKKTKELVIDFRRMPTTVPDLYIDDVKVERVNEYKYLGTVIDNKLNFDSNTHTIHKKCQSRLYCLQKLRQLRVNKKVMCSFYRCFLESVLTFGFMCWFGGLNVKNKNVLERVVNVSGKVTGEKQQSLSELYERRMVKKAGMIARDSVHILAQYYNLLPSGRRYRVHKTGTVRTRNSFVHRSITLLNKL